MATVTGFPVKKNSSCSGTRRSISGITVGRQSTPRPACRFLPGDLLLLSPGVWVEVINPKESVTDVAPRLLLCSVSQFLSHLFVHLSTFPGFSWPLAFYLTLATLKCVPFSKTIPISMSHHPRSKFYFNRDFASWLFKE